MVKDQPKFAVVHANLAYRAGYAMGGLVLPERGNYPRG
jgi:hypothetical protein